jgi:protein O-mannosyl-transferase
VGLFVLALLARSTNVMLPLILLVLDVYPLRRLGHDREGAGREAWPVVREKLPFVALSVVFGLLAAGARIESEGVFGRAPTDVGAGAAVAAFALARYVAQTFWPWGVVSPLNEMPSRLDPTEARFLASGAVVAVITLALIAGRRRWPAALAAWLCYGLILLPTSGLVPFGTQLTADRYTYVACLGFSYLVAGALLVAWQRWQRGALGTLTWMAVAGLVVVTVAGFAVVSARRVAIWRDSKTLWTYTASVEPGAVIPQVSLGLVFEREGRLADAVRHFRQAAALRPADARIRTDLGRALARQGRLAEAVRELETAVRLSPEFADAHLTLGGALLAEGRPEAALERYRAAARLRPDSAAIHYNLAQALAGLGRLAEAVDHYRTALAIQPGFAEARASLERLLQGMGASATGPDA